MKFSQRSRQCFGAVALLFAGAGLQAQDLRELVGAPLQNVAQLSASGSAEAQQDVLMLSLSTLREAADAAAVQR